MVPLDYQTLMDWPFAPVTRTYSRQDCMAFARGFGAGAHSNWHDADAPYLHDTEQLAVLPVVAVALADGEFWQMDPRTGIQWEKIVHTQETLRIHTPLPASGKVVVTQKIDGIYDRGIDKGAVMLQNLNLHSDAGTALASIEVTTLLRGNGGFGGQPQNAARPEPLPERAADLVIDIPTPPTADTLFRLSPELAIAAATQGSAQAMIRGVGCFGLAGRGVVRALCANSPQRLTCLSVRYAGPMYSGETMRMEIWHTHAGQAVLRMHAIERNQPVLSYGRVEFNPA